MYQQNAQRLIKFLKVLVNSAQYQFFLIKKLHLIVNLS